MRERIEGMQRPLDAMVSKLKQLEEEMRERVRIP